VTRKSKPRPPVAIQRVNKMLSRQEMALALELQANGDQDMLDLAKLLRSSHPSTSKCSPHTLAAQIGIPYSRIVSAFKESKRMETVVAVAQRLPAIGEGIAQDAESKSVTCPTCEGSGVVAAGEKEGKTQTKTCIPCEGSGSVTRSGDPVARKQVLEMMQMVGASAMPINAPGANILISSGSLEDTLRAAKGAANGTIRATPPAEGDQRLVEADSRGDGDSGAA
jgi:hypothetical protein